MLDLFIKLNDGDNDALLTIISQFNPLLKKYAKKLNYEDAYEDLLVDFIELLRTVNFSNLNILCEGAVISYISKSIRHVYIRLLDKQIKKNRREIFFSNLSQEQTYYLETATAVYNTNDIIKELNLKNILNEYEFKIIFQIYSLGLSSAEISRIHNTSRQSVNQTKNRALKKIKDSLA